MANILQKKDPLIKELQKQNNTPKTKLKCDCQIVAEAVSKGAKCIYSYDNELAKFAEGFLEVRQMPEISIQQNLL